MTISTLIMLSIIALGVSVYFSFLYQKIGLYSLGKIDLFVLQFLCFYVYMFFLYISILIVCRIALPDVDFFDDSSLDFSVYFVFFPVTCFLFFFVDVISDFIYGKYLNKVFKNSGEQASRYKDTQQ